MLMKKVFFTLFCLTLGISAVNAQNNAATPTSGQKAPKPVHPTEDLNVGIFKFDDSADTHNFGEVPEGPLAEWDFIFRNVGKKPIIITEAHGSCGCTVPTWPKDTIMPAKKRFFGLVKGKSKKYKIHVTYNTNGRQGAIMKEVIITSNAKQQPMTLHIRGFVKPKPTEAPAPPVKPTPPPSEVK